MHICITVLKNNLSKTHTKLFINAKCRFWSTMRPGHVFNRYCGIYPNMQSERSQVSHMLLFLSIR